ncbi:SUMF1/EgtB/PvdO family nonheme iron enzyme [uncultured Thiocystis sp.]|jgi:hypothetical protein|uniref:formylglycine-generating enzyme family protein n=1 Tax=uncultured Thiocystis sp. TaxID=1202134 RepID=UPI0025EBA57F|nr:SUMF1/EgtB/PvdO family nonheme iron enzyme [uncultured Thiocystis sp.]
MLRRRLMLLTLALVVVTRLSVAEQGTPDNPRPAEGDLALPLPDDVSMVFRPVRVPGKSFWGGEERIIQLGDPDGGMFEGLQRVQISGSFPDSDQDGWLYFIGKYEVSKRQYIALMGMETFLAESANPKDKTLSKLTGAQLEAALAEPLSGLGVAAIEAFVQAYNKWLFDPEHPERLQRLPRLDTVPGYLRLPTEIEWEYAARDGEVAIKAKTFGETAPVSAAALNNYAWHRDNAKSKVRPIGLREPNALGLHDMLGNVQELSSQRFLPEIWQGKPGGMVARGGSVLTPAKELRSSTRAEVGIFRWNPDRQRMEEQKSLTTGMRLAIGSDVVVSPEYWKTLQGSYDAYKESIRSTTPVGMTLEHPVSQGATAVGMAHAGIDELMSKNKELSSELNRIKSYIETAEQKMDQAQHEGARSLAQDVLRNAANAGAFLFSAAHMEARAKDLGKMTKQLGDRFKDQLKLIEDKVVEKRQNATEQLDVYAKRVAELGEYGSSYVDQAIKILEKKDLSERERTALVLVTSHVGQYRVTRRILREEWGNDFAKAFSLASE